MVNQSFFGAIGIVFGTIALARVKQTIDGFRNPPEDKSYWLYSHIIGMSAEYVATLTAFLVVNIHFFTTTNCVAASNRNRCSTDCQSGSSD